MARSNRPWWFPWPRNRASEAGPQVSDIYGPASYFAEGQLEQRRSSGEWPELGDAPVTPPNLSRPAHYGAENRHLSRPGRWFA